MWSPRRRGWSGRSRGRWNQTDKISNIISFALNEPINMIGVMTERPDRKVVRLPVVHGVGELMAQVRSIAKDTAKVFLTDHAVNRMYERGISDIEVFKVLRIGEIRGAPWLEEDGSKACKVVLAPRGDRAVGVVTILIDTESVLVVKTVEWEDWQ